MNSDSKILVCVHSNTSGDLFTESLSTKLDTTQLFRMNAFHRNVIIRNGAFDILKYSSYNQEKRIFEIPPLEVLLSKRVVVTTPSKKKNIKYFSLFLKVMLHNFMVWEFQIITTPILLLMKQHNLWNHFF